MRIANPIATAPNRKPASGINEIVARLIATMGIAVILGHSGLPVDRVDCRACSTAFCGATDGSKIGAGCFIAAKSDRASSIGTRKPISCIPVSK